MVSTVNRSSFKVAVVQHPPVFLNLEASLARALELISEAAGAGAQLVVFPESWLPGYPVWLDCAPQAALWDHPPAKALFRRLTENSLVFPGPEVDTLRQAAKQAGAEIVMGAHERIGGTLYNIMVFLGRSGEAFRIHRKLVPTYTERLVWGRGDGSTLGGLDTAYGFLGGLICWEHWMPLARAAMHAKNEMVHVAQWPTVNDLHQLASRHYAFEGQCFVLAAGCVLSRGEVLAGAHSLGATDDPALELLAEIPGDDATLLMRGGSAVIAPDTNYLAAPVFDQRTVVYAEIDPACLPEGRMALDVSGHYSRPDVFQLVVNDQPQPTTWFASQRR